jgi:hypothetical protein
MDVKMMRPDERAYYFLMPIHTPNVFSPETNLI